MIAPGRSSGGALGFAGGVALAFIAFALVAVGRGLDFRTALFASPATVAWRSAHRALASRRAHCAGRGRP